MQHAQNTPAADAPKKNKNFHKRTHSPVTDTETGTSKVKSPAESHRQSERASDIVLLTMKIEEAKLKKLKFKPNLP
jgi:hypothetical protein